MKAVYIHIPFCSSICTYCDFSKMYAMATWIDDYLDALDTEIKQNYRQETIKTLYFGGGTPSLLSIDQLQKLFKITGQLKLAKNCEITFECNPEDLTLAKLEFLKDKVNRLSIGIQSFQAHLNKILGRQVPEISRIKLAKQYFKNINIDLIYNLNEQTFTDLKNDIATFLSLDIPHISTYSLIVEPHTKLFIQGYHQNNDDIQSEEYLNEILKHHGYNHYEISNYAKPGYESKHNLTYWNNDNYYGFGLASSGYIDNQRYENTRNFKAYINGKFQAEKHKLSLTETLQNEFILGLRKIKGVNRQRFKQKYGFYPETLKVVQKLLNQKYLKQDAHNLYIAPQYLYLSNEILLNFMDTDLLKH